ncbi:MAG: serpin family protein [Methanolinea sp.]|nr:serpin family protein [Methanolinea sp.]
MLFLAGCTDGGQSGHFGLRQTPVLQPGIQENPPSFDKVVDANNRFALDLYHQLARDPEYGDGNIFFSPFSISTALAITYEGARGHTADEIRAVFHFPDNTSILRYGYSDLIAQNNRESNTSTLRTANALWAEKTYAFLPDYRETAERYYGARITNLDFVNAPEDARVMINRWVEGETENRIRDLLPRGVIDPTTCLVITNAIYFKGTWKKQFETEETKDAAFRTGDGSTVQVPMMQRTDENATFGYMETGTFQALSLPYESGGDRDISMLLILPKDDSLAAVERSFDIDLTQDIQSRLVEQRVQVYIPRFSFETKYFLPRVLSSMGMPLAFTPGADFSGMDGRGGLFITNVIHQAFVEVNEEGTEAASATAVILGKGDFHPAEGIPVFRADHPFIVLIQDKKSGAIFFLGRVSNPVLA